MIHWTSLLIFCNIQKSLEHLWKSSPMTLKLALMSLEIQVMGEGEGGGEYHTFDTDGKLTQLGYGLFIFFRSMFKLQKI